MASSVYFKSFTWLILCGGLGYGLMQIVKPSDKELSEIRSIGNKNQSEERRKVSLVLEHLKEAASYPKSTD